MFINREEKYVQPVKNFFWDFENLKKLKMSAHFKVHFLRLQIKFQNFINVIKLNLDKNINKIFPVKLSSLFGLNMDILKNRLNHEPNYSLLQEPVERPP